MPSYIHVLPRVYLYKQEQLKEKHFPNNKVGTISRNKTNRIREHICHANCTPRLDKNFFEDLPCIPIVPSGTLEKQCQGTYRWISCKVSIPNSQSCRLRTMLQIFTRLNFMILHDPNWIIFLPFSLQCLIHHNTKYMYGPLYCLKYTKKAIGFLEVKRN